MTVLRPGSRLAQASELRDMIRWRAPDVVHATLFDSCLLSRLATPRGIGLVNSLVSTNYARVRVQELGAAPLKRRAVWAVDRLTISRVTHVHALTGSVALEAQNVLGVRRDRITIVPRGRSAAALGERSEERRSRVRAGLGLEPSRLVFVNAARQEPPKAQALLVRAFARVLADRPDATLLVAGREGNATADLRAAIEETGTGEAVRMLGYREDVADLVAASDIFVFPSHYEGLGSVLIEAMAVGTPIVASDIPAIREVLADGEAGRLTPRGDADSLATALLELAADPELRADLARRGRERFLSTYTLEHVVDQTVALYRRAAPTA